MRLVSYRMHVAGVALAFWTCTLAAEPQRPTGDANEGDRSAEAYILGPEDQIAIWALGAPELSEKPYRVDPGGYIDLPLIGQVKAGGVTIEQLKVDLTERLKEYLREPQVSVSVAEHLSQPVSVIGAVRNPGVHLLQGRKTLVEILAQAGGLQPDAGHSARITRKLEWGRIPLPIAADDITGKFSVAEVSLKAVIEAERPEGNILMQPHDVVSIPRAETVYVMGEVTRPGGFVLNEREVISVLQALSMAGGLNRSAAPKRARILRFTPGAAQRTEIPLDLNKILAGQTKDVGLKADDILFIPNNTAKNIGAKAIETAIQLGLGIAIFGR